MRQQDYKMVQGGNTRVNMNVGAATQAGSAMAKLGQTLAQTGQDVSKIMEVTVEAQEKTDLIRAKQKWKEIQAKQSIFEEKNKRDPLLWDENRQKLMKEFDAYNSELKTYTKNGSLNLQLNKESWASDFKYNTLKGMQKRINMNLAGETIASVQDRIDNNDPLGAQRALDDGRGALNPEAEAQLVRGIQKSHEDLIYNDGVDMIDADPKGQYDKIKNSEGHYAHYKNDRETREKLLAESTRRQAIQAREQADNLTARINSSIKFTSKDLEDMIENRELSQYSDGNLAKLRASVKRDEPATQAEIMGAYKLIIDLEKRRPNMTTMEYVEEYNNLEATVLSVMPAKGKGWVRQYLYSINPSSKDAGSSVEKSKTRAKKEATKVLVALQDMGAFLPSYTAPIEMGSLLPEFEVEPPLDTGEFKQETLKVQEQSRQQMADAEAELFDFIENYEGELTNEVIRTKAGEVMGTQRVNKAVERINRSTQPKDIQNKNLYRSSNRTSGRTMRGSWQNKVNVDRSLGAANVRYNNPSAAYPRKEDEKYGIEGYGTIGGGHKIGKFPSPIHGAAANFDLFADNYTNMTFQKAMNKWRGKKSPVPKGYNKSQIIDKNFLNDPSRAIDFFKKMALHESPDFAGMTDADWMSAWEMWKANS